MVEIAVRILCETWSEALADPEGLASDAATAALARSKDIAQGDAELTVVFADASFVRALNRDYRGHDRSTNVLAFPSVATGVNVPRLLGDVVLAYDVVQEEAAHQGKALSDHVRHLVVHGTLHLLGFDHDTDDAAEEMESAEVEILATLGVSNPYLCGTSAMIAEPPHG